MIFEKYETKDGLGNIIDGVGFAPIARKKQEVFDRNMFEDTLKKQKQDLERYNQVYNETFADVTDTNKAFYAASDAISSADDATKKYTQTAARGTIDLNKFEQAQRANFEAQQKLHKGFKGFSTSMKAMGLNLGIDLLAGLAINAISNLVSYLNDEFKITSAKKIEAMETAVNDYNGAMDESKSNISTLKSMQSEFDALATGVDDAGNNIGLSANEFERYNQIVAELAKLNPSLVQGYTAEGNAIINRNKAIQESIDLQKQYADNATRDYMNKDEDISEGVKVKQKDSLKEMSNSMQKAFDERKIFSKAGVFGGIAGSNSMKSLFEDALDEEIKDANSLTLDQYEKIAQKRDEILDKAKNEKGFNEENLTVLTETLDTIDSQVFAYQANSQELAQWLQTYVSTDKDLGGAGLAVPEEYASGYSKAVQEIAKNKDLLSEDELKTQAVDLAKELSTINSSGEMRKYVSDIEKAQKTFRNSEQTAKDIKKYNDAITDSTSGMEKLSESYSEQAQTIIEGQTAGYKDFADRKNLNLSDVFNTNAEAIDGARRAKETYDAAMQNGDYYTSSKSFKEIYDTMYDGENNKGRGSLGWWQGAEQFLGDSTLSKLDYDYDKVSQRVKELKPLLANTSAAAGNFAQKLWDVGEEGKKGTRIIRDEFGEAIAKVKKDADGKLHYDIPNENFSAVAEKLQISEDLLVGLVDKSRQWANIIWDEPKDIARAIGNMDSTWKKGDKKYQWYDTVQKEAQKQGLSPKEFSDSAKQVERETNTSFLHMEDGAKKLMKSFSKMGLGTFKKNKKTGDWSGVLSADEFVGGMNKMGRSAEDTIKLLKRLKKSGKVKFDGLEKGQSIEDYVNGIYDDIVEQEISWEITDTDKMVNSIDQVRDALEQLTLTMNGVPALTLGDDVDNAEKSIKSYISKIDELSDAEKTRELAGIEGQLDELEKTKKAYKEKAEDPGLNPEQQKAYAAAVEDTEKQMKTLKDVVEDLQDGKLDDWEIDPKTGNLQQVKKELQDISEKKRDAKIGVKVEGQETVENFLKDLELTDDTKQTVIEAVTKFNQQDMESYEEILNSLPPNVRTVVEAITGNTVGTLVEIDGKLKILDGKEATTYVKTEVKNTDSTISDIEEQLNGLEGQTVTKEVKLGLDSDIEQAKNQIERLNQLVKTLPEGEKRTSIEADIKVSENAIEKLENQSAKLKVEVDTTEANKADEKISKMAAQTSIVNVQVKVTGDSASKIDGISDSLERLGKVKANPAVKVNVSGIDKKISNITGKLNLLKTIRPTIPIKVKDQTASGINSIQSKLQALDNHKVTVSANVQPALTGINAVLSRLSQITSQSKSVNLTANASASGLEQIDAYNEKSAKAKSKKVQFTASESGVQDTVSSINQYISAINSAASRSVTFTTTYREVRETVTKEIKEGNSSGSKNRPRVPGSFRNFDPRFGPVPHKAEGSKERRKDKKPVDSMARGGGKKKGGMTLTGELAPELVWVPSQGIAFIVGQNGPEMINLPADAVVYPGDETRRILAGKATHKQFGSMAGGGGLTPGGSGSGSGKSSSRNNTKTNNKDDKIDKTAKETKEIYDWIEIKLDRIQRKIDRYDKKVNETNRSFEKRKKLMDGEIKQLKKELSLQEKGAKRYSKRMKKVKLPKKYQKLVKEGKISISTVKDEGLNKKIQRYQELYEKFLACKDAAIDLKEQITELRKQKFDLTITKYDGILSGYETKSSMTEERMNQAENRGHFASKNYYNRLKQIERVGISKKENERAELQKQLKQMVKIKGKDFVGSEMWHEMVGEINEVSMSIEESKTKLTEYDQALRELDYEAFDYLLEQISKITEESDFLIDIMSNDKLYTDKGQLTDEGMASMGLHGLNYNVYMKEADKYAAKIKEIQKELEKDPASKEFLDKKNEYIKLQQEAISAAEDEKDAIVDMVEEGIKLELDSLKELIDSYKDALSSQQDLYNYQKKISDQTKDIASLQKQLSAYANDTSEESKAKIQKLKVSLEDAKQNLKDTEYDHYIDAQKELLDDLYEEYEEILNKRLDNVDLLVSDMIDVTNKNAANIAETIQREAEEVGYTTTETMHNIWKEGGEAHDVIKFYGEQFATQTSSLASAITSLSLSIDRMRLIANLEANDSIKDVHNKVESNQVGDDHLGQVNGGGLISQLGGALGNLGNNSMASTPKKTETALIDMEFDKFLKKYKKKYTGDRAAAERNHYKTITGLLKYNDLDPSVSARKAYWKKLGNKGDYKDTDAQNKTLISQFKKRGYKRGARSIMQNQMAWTNEGAPETIIRKSDGAILTPLKSGDMVLNPDAHSNIWNMASDPTKFIRDHFDFPVPAATNIKNDNRSSDSYQNDYHIEISLPNVQSYEDFVTAMQHDKKLEKMLQDMTVNQVFGGSSLKKYKY